MFQTTTMPEAGLEPARARGPRDFKSLVSANSTTPATLKPLKFKDLAGALYYHKAFGAVKTG